MFHLVLNSLFFKLLWSFLISKWANEPNIVLEGRSTNVQYKLIFKKMFNMFRHQMKTALKFYPIPVRMTNFKKTIKAGQGRYGNEEWLL